MEKIASILIATHFIGDFLLQPVGLVKRKGDFKFLLLHSAIHGALAYVALQAWKCWEAPLVVIAIHTCIDGFKQREKDTATVFATDQIVHALSLLGLAFLLDHHFLPLYSGLGYKPLVAFGGLVATVRAAGFLVAKFAKPMMEENQIELDGLPNGGKTIGQLERALIFLFIFTDQAAGIGFLVAAKSILRFEETKNRKLAEYVLIGTLLSFSLAIALASVTKWAVAFPEPMLPAPGANITAVTNITTATNFSVTTASTNVSTNTHP
jgi:hypothetical protein